MRRRSILFVAACLLPALASATTVPLPDGMCALDASKPEQSIVINYMRTANIGFNQVLATFAPCEELDALSKKKINGLTHYGSVLSQDLHSEIPMDRATYLSAVATTYQQSGKILTDAALGQSGGAIASGAAEAGINNPASVSATSKGILYQDPRMVMIGLTQTNAYGGTPVEVASTASITLVGTTSLSVNYYEPLSEDKDFSKSKALLTRYTNQIIRAN